MSPGRILWTVTIRQSGGQSITNTRKLTEPLQINFYRGLCLILQNKLIRIVTHHLQFHYFQLTVKYLTLHDLILQDIDRTSIIVDSV